MSIDTGTSTSSATKACDFCGERILLVARKCKHCGETLDPAMRKAEEALRARQSGGGGGGAAASTTVVLGHDQRRNFPHFAHLLLTVLTMGLWFPLWVLHYLFRGNTYR